MYIKQPVFHGSSIRGFFYSWLICAGVQTPIGVVRDKLINPRVGLFILGGSSQGGLLMTVRQSEAIALFRARPTFTTLIETTNLHAARLFAACQLALLRLSGGQASIQ